METRKVEKIYKGESGYVWLFIGLLSTIASVLGIAFLQFIPLIALLIVAFFILIGLITVNPNESCVLVLFGDYKGTIKDNGFFWVNPFFTKKKLSLRARNFNNEPIKVNDKVGNPIMIGLVLVWKVEDTFKALFAVDQYEHFVRVQSEAALRKLAGHYPYDNFDENIVELTLRAGGEEVSKVLENELSDRLSMAGIQVIEARISYIAYAAEIAGAMLRRQQATAVVAARGKIVEGAVGMVQQALKMLSEKNIIEMDEERKAAMVSNLLVVLCSDEAAKPIVNAGTLHP
jgi:regulator of protease activity HflC (stomatin/prohibitin superfamily)